MQVAPHKKLPSLYVLDSIVKNVGTPYTLFFGKRLYDTYMNAYASVDMPTRRKMDEMLRTWKEPIPGSIDTRPVFPPDVTRPIENALLKARTSAMELQQRNEQKNMGRARQIPQGAPYRDTSTPPGVRPPSQVTGYPVGPPPAQNSNGIPYGQPTQPPPAQYPFHHVCLLSFLWIYSR
jgi:pre-mRNA cleavage complex 2 protein Pcf11